MTTWTTTSKSSSSWNSPDKSTVGALTIAAGTMMGLPFGLTYAEEVTVTAGSPPTWTASAKS